MTLSVIVPVYNSEKYLRRCLDSILAQTRLPDEIICVNDGSTDGSGAILEEYAKKNSIIKVITKENGGLVSARKAGIKSAIGYYATYVDADDYIEKDMYDKLLGYAQKYNSDLVTSGFIRDYGNDVTIEKEGFAAGSYSGKDYKDEILANLISTEVFYKYNILTSVCNKIFIREKLLPIQLKIDDCINMGEDDAVTYSYLFSADNIYISGEEYYHYCIRNDSMTGTENKDDEYCLDLMLGFVKNVFESNVSIVNNINKQYKFYELNYRLIKEPRRVLKYENGRLFPFGDISKLEKIVLYGAGVLGVYIKKWMEENGFNIIAFVDRNGGKNGILFPEQLNDIEFERILITVTNASVKKSIKKSLKELGIRRDKILFITPNEIEE